jgi:hypothetical protein
MKDTSDDFILLLIFLDVLTEIRGESGTGYVS